MPFFAVFNLLVAGVLKSFTLDKTVNAIPDGLGVPGNDVGNNGIANSAANIAISKV